VPGDIVLLEAGDKVPADLRLIEVASLSVEEAILTGESVPVRKQVEPVEDAPFWATARSDGLSGTMVPRAPAPAWSPPPARDTEIGRISGLLANVEQLTTPLIRQMGQFARC
jgi:magnesium-transporting ATPase (P-type)